MAKVVVGLSGGVDSSVAAVLLHKAVGERLTCVFVDHGLLRKDEGDYVEKTFSMYKGQQQTVRMRFVMSLYETVAEQFGSSASYYYNDEHHFTVLADVNISDQFYGWLCGLGKRVKIISPEYVANDYKAFLDKIRKMYDSD